MQKILKYIVIGGLFLVPLSVLIVANSLFFPFITGKAFFYRTIVEIIFAAWVLLMLVDKQYRPYKQKIYYALLALLGLLFVSNILSVYPYKAFWSNFERMDGWVALIHHVMFFVVISSVFTTYKMWEKFWKLSLAVSVIVCFYGFLQKMGVLQAIQGGYRIDGTFGNAAYLAVYNLFNIFLAVWLLYKSKIRKIQVIYGLVGLFNLLNLYWTATRGAFVGLAVGVIVSTVLIIVLSKGHKKAKLFAGGVLALLIIFTGTVFALRGTDFVKHNEVLSRIATITPSAGATRFTVWGMALNGVKDRPVIGWGQEGFSPVFAKYYEPNMYNQEPWFDRAHNIVIDWLIAGGILGLILYLSVLVIGFRYIWQSEGFDNFEKSIFTGMYAGYFIQNLFVFDNIGSYILFFSTLAFFTVSARKESDKVFDFKAISSDSLKLLQPAILIVLIIVVYTVNIRPLRAGQEFIKAYIPNQKPELVIEAFDKSLGKGTFAHYEVTEQMMTQAPNFLKSQNISDDLKKKYMEVLVPSLESELKKQPEKVRLLYATGVFWNSIGQSEKALEYLRAAHELSPQKQIVSFELGFATINNGDEEGGMNILRETYELAPEFEEAKKMYALGAIYTGDKDLESKLILDLTTEVIVMDSRFIQAYANTKRYGDLLEAWKLRTKVDPGNIQNYVSLAATYLEVGNKSEAIATLRKAIDLEPAFKEQGEQFIKDIEEGRL